MKTTLVSLIVAAIVTATGTAVAQPAGDAGCVPACRSGYTCVAGNCVSACNPLCAPGETCTDVGQCVAAPAAAPVAPMSGDVIAQAAPSQTVAPPGPAPAPGQQFAPMVAQSASPRPWFTSYAFGLQAGVLFAGEAYADFGASGGYFDTDAGLMLRLTLDDFVTERFSFGGFGQMAFSGANDSSVKITTVGVSLKAHFGSSVKICPGLELGYQREDFESGDPANGLGIGFVVDAVFPMGTNQGVLTLGFISQAAGGNADFDLTFSPHFFLAGGMQFGK